MRLKAADTVRSSRGPSTGSGSGVSPRPRRAAARVSAASGRAMREAIRPAPSSASASSAAPQASHSMPKLGSKRPRGSMTQNWSTSIGKLTQKPSRPLRAKAKRVCAPERLAHPLGDHAEQRIIGQRLELLVRGHRIDADALALVQLDQQLGAQRGIGVDQRRAREVDHAHRLLRELARQRLALVQAVELERRQHRDHQQQRDQQERARQQRVGRGDPAQPHFDSPSGTNT